MDATAPREIVKLTVTLLSDGQVTVSGPLMEKLQCYGMLECAKDAIRAYQQPTAPSLVRSISPHVNGAVK